MATIAKLNGTNADLAPWLRHVSHARLTPKEDERRLVSDLYVAYQECLGRSSCFQSGSFARFTAIRPLHDLDIIFVAGSEREFSRDARKVLEEVRKHLEAELRNPTPFKPRVKVQSHSVAVGYFDGETEVFAVDVVPAYSDGANEFGDTMFIVPEIVKRGHAGRRALYDLEARGAARIDWIRSDPKGYISEASTLNTKNADFRRAVKCAKGWKAARKREDSRFPLKSFHIELSLGHLFRREPSLTVEDALLEFARSMRNLLARPQLADRADPKCFVDSYVGNLTAFEKAAVVQCADELLRGLLAATTPTEVESALLGSTAASPTQKRPAAPAPVVISRPTKPWSA